MTTSSVTPPGNSPTTRFKCLLGATPGILDPAQVARVLHNPASTLSFAILDPDPLGRVAHGASTEADGKYRIAIEELPAGAGTARYKLVPNAELASGVQHEGTAWPRVVKVSGEVIVCSQEQWYIYKLDPAYVCYVRPAPHPPIISRREPDSHSSSRKRPRPNDPEGVEDLSRRFREDLTFCGGGASPVNAQTPSCSGPEGGRSEGIKDNVSPPASQSTSAGDDMEVTPGDLPGSSPCPNQERAGHVPSGADEQASVPPCTTDSGSSSQSGIPRDDAGPVQGLAGFAGPSAEARQPEDSSATSSAQAQPETVDQTMENIDNLEGSTSKAETSSTPQPTSSTPQAEVVDLTMDDAGEDSPMDDVASNCTTGDAASDSTMEDADFSMEGEDFFVEDEDFNMEDAPRGPPSYPAKRKGDKDQPTSPPKRARTTHKPRMSAAEKRAAERTAKRRTTRLAEKERLKKEEREDRDDSREDTLWTDILNTTPNRGNTKASAGSSKASAGSSKASAGSSTTSFPSSTTSSASSASSTTSFPSSTTSSASSASSTTSTSAASFSTSSTSTSTSTFASSSAPCSDPSTPSTASGSTAHSEWSSTSSASTLSDEPTAEDLERMASIEASRRKIAELEKDKPLWEKAAKRREEEEQKREEEKAREAEQKAAERRKKMETEQRRRQAQQAMADREAAKARAVRIHFLEVQAKEERSRLRRRYSGKYWGTSDAINHFVTAGSAFDSAKFTTENPPVFDKVPWPTLLPPWELKEKQVNWEQVESFFKRAYARMSIQDYKDFVEKAHRRFHPDRWRARQFWKTIGDQEWAGNLDAVANKVSQAISPIWVESRRM